MRSISSKGQIVFTYVLSLEGRCVAYPVGVSLRLFPFIEFWVRKGILDFKKIQPRGCFEFFYSDPQLDQNLKPTRNLCGQLLYIYLCIYMFSV